MVGNEEVGGQGKYGKPDLTLSERFDFHTSFSLSGQPGPSIYGYRAEAEAVLPRPPNPIKSLAFLLLIQPTTTTGELQQRKFICYPSSKLINSVSPSFTQKMYINSDNIKVDNEDYCARCQGTFINNFEP